jgi:hypothetical protein
MTEPYGPSTPTDPGDEPIPASGAQAAPNDTVPESVPAPAAQATPSEAVAESIPAGASEVPPVSPAADGTPSTPPDGTPSTPPDVKPGVGIPKRLLRLAAVVVVVVVGVIGYLVFFQKSDPTAAKVGDCVSITGPSNLATATRLSCDDQKALYVVLAAGKTVTCDSNEVSYSGSTRDRTKLCLFYNARVGDCLKLTQNGDGSAKGTCTAGMLKVLLARTDTADKTQCPADADGAMADTTRTRLICFSTVR